MSVISMKQLLEAGVHFGHQTRRWNPKMAEYIYTERNGIHIIDLQKSVGKVDEAYKAVADIAANGGTILFVGTKKQAQDAIASEAERCGMFYVNERWLGGMLTNFKTIQSRINRLKEIEAMEEDGTFDVLPKKEVINLKKELEKLTGKKLIIEIKEVKRFDVDKDAQLVAENIAQQLENRISFRRAMKSCMQRTMRNGALGIKTSCSGRLGGADMARTEFYSEGTIPLQTLRANIDYGFAEANTTYGKVGVKVWVYHGEVLPTKETKEGSDK